MRAFLALLLGLCGLVTGFCLTADVAYWLAGLAGMSDFEGGRGMFAGLVAAPVGAIAGLIAGAVLGWSMGKHRLTPNSLLVLLLLIAASITAVVATWQAG